MKRRRICRNDITSSKWLSKQWNAERARGKNRSTLPSSSSSSVCLSSSPFVRLSKIKRVSIPNAVIRLKMRKTKWQTKIDCSFIYSFRNCFFFCVSRLPAITSHSNIFGFFFFISRSATNRDIQINNNDDVIVRHLRMTSKRNRIVRALHLSSVRTNGDVNAVFAFSFCATLFHRFFSSPFSFACVRKRIARAFTSNVCMSHSVCLRSRYTCMSEVTVDCLSFDGDAASRNKRFFLCHCNDDRVNCNHIDFSGDTKILGFFIEYKREKTLNFFYFFISLSIMFFRRFLSIYFIELVWRTQWQSKWIV